MLMRGFTSRVRVPYPSRLPIRRRCCVQASQSNGKDPSSTIASAREAQEKASKSLAQLLEAPDPEAMAASMVDELTESFFLIASTYLQMAKKESETVVAEKLETVLKIAMQAKNKTLRPEIQLLNELLAEDSVRKRKRILSRAENKKTLTMNDRYFFGLLERMQKDVQRQPVSMQNRNLFEKLDSILKEATKIENNMN